MKKEVLLAITIGFFLGLIITFGIWTANKSLKDLPKTAQNSPATAASISPTILPTSGAAASTPAPSGLLSIISPGQEALITTPTVTVTGKTVLGGVVTLTYPKGDQIVTADSTGSFTADIALEGGYNRITLTAFDPSGAKKEETITVTYTTQKI